jgi:hypothetical protein
MVSARASFVRPGEILLSAGRSPAAGFHHDLRPVGRWAFPWVESPLRRVAPRRTRSSPKLSRIGVGSSHGPSGNLRQNRAPGAPSSTQMRPPCASTASLQKVSPRPRLSRAPGCSRDCICKNGSNTLSRMSSGTRLPASATRSSVPIASFPGDKPPRKAMHRAGRLAHHPRCKAAHPPRCFPAAS